MRRRLALALFVLIAVASTDVTLFRAPPPDAFTPHEYEMFLEGLREQTKRGDSIALVVPTRSWDGGYAFYYYRASYVLAGREVLPLVGPGDSLHLENVGKASHVAVWRTPVEGLSGRRLWSFRGGELIGR